MNLEQILRTGASPNPFGNSTLAAANGVKAILAPFLGLLTIAVNTAVAWPANSAMEEVDGHEIPADVLLNYNVVLQGVGRTVDFNVANIWRVCQSKGPREAVTICLDVVMPGWKDNQELAAKVAALPGIPPKPTVIVDPPSAPVPDWEQPFSEGHLANRIGDLSPNGTRYTSPAGVVWEKGFWLTPFTSTWKRV